MRAYVLAVALAVSFTGSAGADTLDILQNLPASFVPRLERVAADAPRVHFLKDGNGCPGASPSCAAHAFLVPGDMVVVLGAKGDYVDAIFTGGPPHFRSTRGWLPKTALAPVSAPAVNTDAAAWAGTWKSGDDSITAAPAAGGRIAISGSAVWGEDDPARVANGGVDTGDFDTSLAPAAMVTFSPSDDGGPARLDPPIDGIRCVLRMWLLGPYLAVSDNAQCGGNNVSFSNLYRRAPK